MKGIRLFFALVIVLAVGEALYFYPLIPDCMAVHFNASGRADGWGSRDHFFLTMGIVFALLVALFGGLPMLIRRLPVSLINLPNKDYWLAPERKQQTLDRLIDQLLFVGTMALLLLDGVSYFTFKANLSSKPALPVEWLWGLIAAFLIINVIWTISLIRSFRRP